jgi:NitT/TauT family transport system substrate-binding protein
MGGNTMTPLFRLSRLFALLGTALLLQGTGALAADAKFRVASTNKEIFDNLPFFVGIERGLFKKEGLDVELSHFRGGGEVVRAVSTGSADVGMVATTAGIIAAAKGEPLKLVSAWSAPAYGIDWVVTPDSPIKSVKDLAGKKVGISRPGSVTHTGLTAVLQANNIQVEIVPVGGPGDGFAALKSGRVAATWYPAPDVYGLIQRGEARSVVEISQFLTEYQQGSLWALEDYLGKNGPLVKKFLVAANAAGQFIVQNPGEAAKIGAKHTGYPEGDVLKAIQQMPKGFFHIGLPTQKNYQGSVSEAVATGAIKEAPALDKVMDKRFLP